MIYCLDKGVHPKDLFEELNSLLDYGVHALRDPAEIEAYMIAGEEGKRIFRASGLKALQAFAADTSKASSSHSD